MSAAVEAPAVRKPPPIGRESLNLPNAITVGRLLLALVLFWLIWFNGLWKTAAALFVVTAATDFLDGWLARRFEQVTTLGRILDPFVDKLVVLGALVFLLEKEVRYPGRGESFDAGLGGAAEGLVIWSGVNAWMVLVILAREMFVSSLRGFMEKHGVDFSADWTGKLKTVLQFTAVFASLLSLDPAFGSHDGFVLLRDVLLWAAVALTAWSGVAYVARAVRALRAG